MRTLQRERHGKDLENPRERQRDPESKRRIQRNSPDVDRNHAGTLRRGSCRAASRCGSGALSAE